MTFEVAVIVAYLLLVTMGADHSYLRTSGKPWPVHSAMPPVIRETLVNSAFLS